MSHFWIDATRDREETYDDLVADLREKEEFRPVVYEDDPYRIFLEVVHGILLDRSVTLLDPEFGEDTLRAIDVDSAALDRTESCSSAELDDIDGVDDLLETVADRTDWELHLYTSGTTGTPKRVTQTLDALTRNVKRGDRFADHVWAFAYNPTHFAGLQVFFQAFYNANPMVYVFESDPGEIGSLFEEWQVTHVSATPTFYRLRLGNVDGTFESVRRLTSGGEAFDPSLREELQSRFPNAKFRNVYALTEAGSLLESDGEAFEIPDEYADRIRVSDEDELLIHESLVGESDDYELRDGWFHTGDVVERLDDGRIRFRGRDSEMINVGGYQVSPRSVETHLRDVEGVLDVAVSGRENSVTGNVIEARAKAHPDASRQKVERRLRRKAETLEEWKRPRIVNVTDELDRTRSGKKHRA